MDLYGSACVSVRDDLVEAHRSTIKTWGAPGNWWNAESRLAIATEVRRAGAAEELPPWVAPSTVAGLLDPKSVLPTVAADVTWRLTNHPGTLTAEWYDQVIEQGLAPEQYVEIVGLVATVNSIDTFARAIGVDPVPLPAANPGEPDRATVADASVSTHWVPTVPARGANVGKALTSVPVARDAWVVLSDAQYVPSDALIGDLSWSRGPLDRMQIELLAARTSLLNECFY